MLLQQSIYHVSIVYTCNTYFVMHWSMLFIPYFLINISIQYIPPIFGPNISSHCIWVSLLKPLKKQKTIVEKHRESCTAKWKNWSKQHSSSLWPGWQCGQTIPKKLVRPLFTVLRNFSNNRYNTVYWNVCILTQSIELNMMRSRGSPLRCPSIRVSEWHVAMASIISSLASTNMFVTSSLNLVRENVKVSYIYNMNVIQNSTKVFSTRAPFMFQLTAVF